jgi:myo-inositol-1(or 4)-monophosphatase
MHIETYQAKSPPTLFGDIVDEIKKNDLFISILTPEGNNGPSRWLIVELTAALTFNKPVIIFREKSIPVLNEFAQRNQIGFNRKAVIDEDADELKKIRDAITEHCNKYGLSPKRDREMDWRYEFAMGQAQSVGSQILALYHDALRKAGVQDKAVKNFPTDADRKANQMLRQAIENELLTQDDGIITEESSNDPRRIESLINEHDFVWIIDPLDGTLNFAYGFPFFCISIGLIRNEKPALGVIYNPTTQELYSGRDGYPSECLDLKSGYRRLLRMEGVKSQLGDAVLMTHISTRQEPRRITLGILDDLALTCRAVRVLGSGSMALVSLALGQFDLFFNYSTHIWDIVPGMVLLQGAGGYVSSSLEIQKWELKSLGVIAASNKTLGEEFRKFLHDKGMVFPRLDAIAV